MATLTAPQISYLTSLAAARIVPSWVADFLAKAEVGVSDGREASKCIDTLKAQPFKPLALPKVELPRETVPVGFYFLENEVYKVKASKNDPTGTRRYAYIFKTDGTNKGHYDYEKGAIYRLTPAHQITVEQAARIGHATGVCCICGRELSDPVSVQNGIGPVCAKKWCA